MTENERRSYNEGVASVWRAIAKVTPRKGDYTLLYNAVHGMEKYPNGFNVKIDSMSESEDKKDKKDKIIKIKFVTDFAGNWKTGDIVETKYLEDGDVLVDGVAKIDTGLLLEHCRIISESEG